MTAAIRWQVGDRLRLRKPHPCGGYEWRLVRVGADMGLVCLTCGRRVMLARDEFNRRVKERLANADDERPTTTSSDQPS
jgi:hypothetical protein